MTIKDSIISLSSEEIAQQLRLPEGERGEEIAARMNDSNKSINHLCIENIQPLKSTLTLSNTPRLLEIGPGNGSFLSTILNRLPHVHYTGIDWSQDMVNLANLTQNKYIKANKAEFVQGTADTLPFENAHFDVLFSVNTLYFWNDIDQTLQELVRVLKAEGQIIIGFGDIDFMKSLPFTAHGFQTYSLEDVQQALKEAGFVNIHHTECKETGLNNAEKIENKHFHCLSATLNKKR